MQKWIKGLLIAGGAYAIWKLVSGANELKTFYDQLIINIKAGNPAIRFAGNIWNPILRIRLNVEFVNPTKTSVSFEKPTVTIFYNGNTIAQSKISNEEVTIRPQDTSIIQNLTFDIPLTSITVVGALVDIARKLRTGIEVKDSDPLAVKAAAVFSTLSSNLDNVLPLFDVSCVIYLAGQPFTYKTKIV